VVAGDLPSPFDTVDFSNAQLYFTEKSLYGCYVPRAAGGTFFNGCNLGVLEGSAFDYTYDAQTGVITICTIFGVDMQNSQGPALGGTGEDACNFGGCGTYQVSWTPDCSSGTFAVIADDCTKRTEFAPFFSTFITADQSNPTCPLVATTEGCTPAQLALNIRPESESEEKVQAASLKPQQKVNPANLKPANKVEEVEEVEKVEEVAEQEQDSQVIKVYGEGRAQQEMTAVKSSSSKWSTFFKFAGGAVAGAMVATVATVLLLQRRPERVPLLVH
jgi:hypothetical protein